MTHAGVIVLSPPETLSYSGPPTTREQELEITRAQVQRVMQTLVGVPIRNEHQDLEVGRVTEAYFDTGGNACVRFELCGDPVVTERTERLIQAGWLRGLSLSHDPSTMRAAEVSLCFRGARPGTVINEWPGSDQIDNAKCKPLSGAPMQAAARSSFVAASAMMSNGSSAPYNPAAQVLVPPHQVGLPAPGQPTGNPNVITHNSLAGMPAGPTRTALGAIQPQELGSGLPMPQQQQAQPQQQQQQTTGAKRRRVTLPNGQEIELTDEEIAQMQQAPQVQASGTAPTAAAPAAAEDDTASKHSDTHEQILHRMVKNGGFLSPEDQEKLISGFARSKRDRTATQAELERHKRESQAELEHYKRKAEAAKGSDEAQRQQMIELLPAFIGTFLGTDANKNREDMRQMLSGEGGEARFMREAVPQLVAASAIAMDRFRHQRQQAPIPSHLQRALDALGDAHTDMQSEGLLPQAFPAAAAPPQPVFSSEKLGWQPQPGLVQASGQRGRAEQQQQAHDPFAVMRQLSQEIGPVTNNVYRRADVMDRIGSVAEPATPQQLINAGLPRVSMPQRRG